MSEDDEAARKSRAQKLREQISKFKKKDEAAEEQDAGSSEEPESEPHGGKSPREFINERMHELDKEDQ